MALSALPLAGEKPSEAQWQDWIIEARSIGAYCTVSQNLPPSTPGLTGSNELRVDFATNSVYMVQARLIYNSNSTANFKFDFTETSAGGVTGNYCVTAIAAGGSALTFQRGGNGVAFTANGAGADRDILIAGLLTTGANAGALALRFAQNTSNASTTSLQAMSSLELRKIA